MPRSDFCRTALSSLKRQAESEAAKYGRLVHMLVLPEGQGVSSMGRVPQFHGRPTTFGRSEIAGRIPPDDCWPKGVEPLCAIVVSPDPRIVRNVIGGRFAAERVHLFFGDEDAFTALEPVAADLLKLRNDLVREYGMERWYSRCLETSFGANDPRDKWGQEIHRRAWEHDSQIHVKPKAMFRGKPIEVDPTDEAFTKYLSFSLLECDAFTATAAIIDIYLRWLHEGPPKERTGLSKAATRFLVEKLESSESKEAEPSSEEQGVEVNESGPVAVAGEGVVTPENDNGENGDGIDANAPESLEGESQKSTVNLKNWAIGRAQTGWKVFHRYSGRWNDRGEFTEISTGHVTRLADTLARFGGCISKTDAIDLFKRDCTGKTDKWIYDTVCVPTRHHLADQIKAAIARISREKVKVPNPIPWDRAQGSWRCEFEIGYAPVGEDGKLRFATADQIGTEALDDKMSSKKAGTMTLPEEIL